jgi:hypothetical protein
MSWRVSSLHGLFKSRVRVGLSLLAWNVAGWSQPISSWQGLEQLKPGQRITWVSTDGSESSGRLKTLSAGEMTLGNDAGELVRVAKERVRVALVRRRPRGNRPLWIGLGAGAAAGAAGGALGASGPSLSVGGRMALAGVGAAMWGALGAGVGALLRGKPEDVVVYRAAVVNKEGGR